MERRVFLEQLREACVLSENQLAASLAGLDLDAPAAVVAAALVEQGTLTPFQARKVCAGEGKGLALGQYRLVDEVGRGGMGQVYKAVHTIMGRTVAIKVISPELVKDELALQWFNREVRATTQLNHPNIVMAFDANEADGLHFLVMEYVEGVNLDAHVKEHGPLAVARAVELMRQAALGLQHAHEKGMVHRDVKPANLLLPRPQPSASGPLVKIVDFGLARLHGPRGGETIMAGSAGLFGTPDYIAPEQSCDIHAADIRSDLYSLACTFYFALSGRLPFPGGNAMEKLVRHVTAQPEPLEELCPELPPALAAIIRRLMDKAPERRFQTPAALAEELACLQLPMTATTVTLNTPPPRMPADLGTVFRPDLAVATPSRSAEVGTVFRPGLAEPAPVAPSAWLGARPADIATIRLPATAAGPPPTVSVETRAPQSPESKTEVASGANPEAAAAPSPTPPPAELRRVEATLRRAWRKWTAVVEAFARQGCYTGSDEEYRLLHKGIIETSHYAASVAEPERRALFGRVEEIARPWLNLTILQRTDHEILETLLLQCQEAQEALGVGGGSYRLGWWLGLMLVSLLPLVLLVIFGKTSRMQLPAWDGKASWQSLLQQFLHRCAAQLESNPLLWLSVVLPVVVLASIFLVNRSPRA